MQVNVVGSGSAGNCILVTDKEKHQIMLDCGLKYQTIVPHVDLSNLDFIVLTHCH